MVNDGLFEELLKDSTISEVRIYADAQDDDILLLRETNADGGGETRPEGADAGETIPPGALIRVVTAERKDNSTIVTDSLFVFANRDMSPVATWARALRIYDGHGRLVQHENRNIRWTYRYDDRGNKVEEVTGDLRTITSYDDAGRKREEKAYYDGSLLVRTMYEYDGEGRLHRTLSHGRIYGAPEQPTLAVITSYSADGGTIEHRRYQKWDGSGATPAAASMREVDSTTFDAQHRPTDIYRRYVREELPAVRYERTPRRAQTAGPVCQRRS